MLRRFVRHKNNYALVDQVELTDANMAYAHIRYPDGRESTVSLRDLAPCPDDCHQISELQLTPLLKQTLLLTSLQKFYKLMS